MFCPPGYVPLSRLYSDAETKIRQKIKPFIFDDKNGLYVDDAGDIAVSRFLEQTECDFIENLIKATIKDDCYICSPNSEVLYFDFGKYDTIFKDAYLSYDDAWGFCQDGVLTELDLLEISASNRFLEYDQYYLIENYTPQDGEFYQFLDKNNCLGLYAWLPLFYERQFYTISTDIYQKIIAAEPQYFFLHGINTDGPIEQLKPFEGWAFCVLETFAQNQWPQKLENEIKNFAPSKTITSSKSGRPAKLPLVIAIYERCYPAGHGTETMTRLAMALSAEMGVDVSVSTVRRALSIIRNSK